MRVRRTQRVRRQVRVRRPQRGSRQGRHRGAAPGAAPRFVGHPHLEAPPPPRQSAPIVQFGHAPPGGGVVGIRDKGAAAMTAGEAIANDPHVEERAEGAEVRVKIRRVEVAGYLTDEQLDRLAAAAAVRRGAEADARGEGGVRVVIAVLGHVGRKVVGVREARDAAKPPPEADERFGMIPREAP